MDDSALLRQFAQTGSHAAFRDLVGRYTNLVYASALTRLRDAHAAQDVTQAVFLTLALKAKDLRPDTSLPGWLFTTTRYVAARYQRGEQRRQEREMRAFEQHQIHQPEAPAAVWEELRPHLAGALDSLSGADREAVLLRFYRQASHRQIAEQLRISENAAEKRVRKALDKMRRLFAKKGVTLSGVALTGALTASASATPTGLAGVVSAAVLTGAGGTLAATETLMLAKGAIQMMFIAKVKSAVLITAACVVVTGTGIVVAQQATKADKDAPVQQAPALTRAPLIAAAPPATNPAQAAPVLRAPALTRDQLIAAADQEASRAWPQHKPNVRAPGFFIPRKPDGCLRDIKVEPQAGLWQVSVVVRLFVAGKENRIGSVSVPLDANGALAGAVQFEGFEGRDGAPAPKTGTTESKPAAPAPAVNEYLAQQTAQLWVNGLLAGRVDRILAVSDVPFGWDKVAVVKTAEELKTKFEGVSKTKGVRNLQAGEATLLKDAEAAAVADRFQLLDTPGLVYVLVKIPNPEKSRGFDPVLLAIKPGNQLKVVGFAD